MDLVKAFACEDSKYYKRDSEEMGFFYLQGFMNDRWYNKMNMDEMDAAIRSDPRFDIKKAQKYSDKLNVIQFILSPDPRMPQQLLGIMGIARSIIKEMNRVLADDHYLVNVFMREKQKSGNLMNIVLLDYVSQFETFIELMVASNYKEE